MKLTNGIWADEIDGDFNGVEFSLAIRGDVWSTEAAPALRDEIIRRVNAHDALVNFCKAVLARIEGSIVNQDLRDAGNAVLALAEKGETS